jgi:hypothetical protein
LLQSGPVLLTRQTILPLQAGLPSGATSPWALSALDLPLGHDLTPKVLRGVDLAHKSLVALSLLRRDQQRHGGEAPAAYGRPDGKTARALCEKAEPRAGTVIDLDPSHLAVRIGIELDRDIVGAARGRAFRHLDKSGGAANAERCGRCRYGHVA